MLIFASKKRRKELDMTTLLMIFGAFLIGMGIGLLDPTKPKKPCKPKKRLFSNSEMDYSKLHFK